MELAVDAMIVSDDEGASVAITPPDGGKLVLFIPPGTSNRVYPAMLAKLAVRAGNVALVEIVMHSLGGLCYRPCAAQRASAHARARARRPDAHRAIRRTGRRLRPSPRARARHRRGVLHHSRECLVIEHGSAIDCAAQLEQMAGVPLPRTVRTIVLILETGLLEKVPWHTIVMPGVRAEYKCTKTFDIECVSCARPVGQPSGPLLTPRSGAHPSRRVLCAAAALPWTRSRSSSQRTACVSERLWVPSTRATPCSSSSRRWRISSCPS